MMAPSKDMLEDLVTAVRASAKYGHLSGEVIRRVGAHELAVRRNLKEAIKATKNKLHQVGAAYMPQPMRLCAMAARASRGTGQEGRLQEACQRIMRAHTSTAERLPILSRVLRHDIGSNRPDPVGPRPGLRSESIGDPLDALGRRMLTIQPTISMRTWPIS